MTARLHGAWTLEGVLALACACGNDHEPAPAAPAAPAAISANAVAAARDGDIPADLPAIDVALLRGHIETLASDAFEGRRPGTPGGKKTVGYLEAQMRALGLEPAGENGTFRQAVPMRGITADPTRTRATLRPAHGEPVELSSTGDVVLGSFQDAGTTQFDAEIVFAGYGVTAGDLEWDDYGELDVKDKIVLVLVGDPPVEDGRFGGEAMTYYGRWTYKFERALAAGAAGCLVVHDSEAASYGWNVVQSSWTGEQFDLAERAGEGEPALRVQGWIHADAAERLAKLAGTSLAAWKEAAVAPGFRARATGVSLHGEVVTTERAISDFNVLGRVPGTAASATTVLVTAHWDHLGRSDDAKDGEDAIFNGAVDNASGLAGILASAAALQAHRKEGGTLARSVVFLATTAEEQGLLGSRWFAGHPLVPLASIAGVVNIDSMNVFGPTSSITVLGAGQSSLEDVLDEVARTEDRVLVPDDRPEAGSYYRSDQFSFARRGVPALYFRGGPEMRDGGREAGDLIQSRRAALYHTVDDEFDPDWPLTGALQDVHTLTQLVIRVANGDSMPMWKPASEFASVRR
jgi:Zn-dependent M28 family amino/carboxypeptidase